MGKLIDNDDLNNLLELRKNYNHAVNQLGILRLEVRQTEGQILNFLAENQQKQNEILKKYGNGKLDLNTGAFTPEEVEIPKLKGLELTPEEKSKTGEN